MQWFGWVMLWGVFFEWKTMPKLLHTASADDTCYSLDLYFINRIQGKSGLQKKSSQIARECMSSYIGYWYGERIILYVIVGCNSNEKQANESIRQQCDGHFCPVLNTTLREVPMLSLERQSARWNIWAIAHMPTAWLSFDLVCLNGL